MIAANPVSRRLLRDEVRAVLLRAIFRGDITPETHMHEKLLAHELDVSRTPLREALLRLEHEGFLTRNHASQLFLKPMTPTEVRELGAMLGLYEASAIERYGVPEKNERDALSAMLGGMRTASDTHDLLQLDHRWHRAFIAKCRNRELLSHRQLVEERLTRYQLAFYEATGAGAAILVQPKASVLRLAEAEGSAAAANRLGAIWETRGEAIAAWLARARSRANIELELDGRGLAVRRPVPLPHHEPRQEERQEDAELQREPFQGGLELEERDVGNAGKGGLFDPPDLLELGDPVTREHERQ